MPKLEDDEKMLGNIAGDIPGAEAELEVIRLNRERKLMIGYLRHMRYVIHQTTHDVMDCDECFMMDAFLTGVDNE